MSEWQQKTAQNLRSQLSVMGQRSMPSGRDGFDEELDSLRALDYKVKCTKDEFYSASLGSNISKNRFRDVLPNEGTRVILDPVNERGDGDYINANYIDARRIFGVPFVYIATQAPMRNTIFDFWRMVFENNAVFIVMLCSEIEAGKLKSERYWPDSPSEPLTIGPLTVELISENTRSETVFRTIALRTNDGKERVIQHLQYIRWPDQSIPQSSGGLMDIIAALGKTQLSTQTPIVVHCSGGVGRTGVFLTLHVALALFQLEQPVSIPRIVQFLKYCRTGMVQRKDQYLFCYYAVLREMERMLWSIDSKRQTNARMNRSAAIAAASGYGIDGDRDLPRRRESEHRPRNAAQSQPAIVKSTLRGTTAAEFMAEQEATAAAYYGDEQPRREFAWGSGAPLAFSNRGGSPLRNPPIPTRGNQREFPSFMRPVANEWAAAVTTDGEVLDRALSDLQRANQQRRQTPSRFVAAAARYDQPNPTTPHLGPIGGGGGGGSRFGAMSQDYRPDPNAASAPNPPPTLPQPSPVNFTSPVREPSEDRSMAGLRTTTPDMPRYSAQPVTPSEGGYDRSPPGIVASSVPRQPGVPLRMAVRDDDGGSSFEPDARLGSRPLPPGVRATSGSLMGGGGGGRSDVQAAIGDFDAAMFAGVKRQDPSII